ncbi:MAG: hypothetical protein ACPF9D_05635 [Owenweeksia sp.]
MKFSELLSASPVDLEKRFYDYPHEMFTIMKALSNSGKPEHEGLITRALEHDEISYALFKLSLLRRDQYNNGFCESYIQMFGSWNAKQQNSALKNFNIDILNTLIIPNGYMSFNCFDAAGKIILAMHQEVRCKDQIQSKISHLIQTHYDVGENAESQPEFDHYKAFDALAFFESLDSYSQRNLLSGGCKPETLATIFEGKSNMTSVSRMEFSRTFKGIPKERSDRIKKIINALPEIYQD